MTSGPIEQCVDPRGHVREAALTAMAPMADEAALPIILGRLNDWVPQVRAAAEKALAPFVNEAKAPLLLGCLALLRRTLKGSRVRPGLWAEVSSVLTKPALAPVLRQAFMAGDKATKLAVLALDGELDPHLVYEATVRGDPGVQAAAAARMLRSPTVYREALQELESSRIPAVRALVLQPKMAKAVVADRIWLRAILVDRSWRLRAQARSRWKELGLGPLEDVYILATASPFPTVRATASTALSEIRAEDAPALLEALLKDPAPAVRGAALTGLSVVAPELAEPLAEALIERGLGTERRAAQAIVKRARQRRARLAKKV